MSLSDDVASLKVGVHKLAVAIEELAIRKYVQGEIDISKLPWFTPQYVPGDSIKLSGSRLPTATVYSDNNEVIASPTPSFLNTSDNSLGAPKVFDKMLEPYSCSNQLKNVATHFSGTQTPTAANLNLPCDKDANLTMVVGQLASLNAFEKDTTHGGESQRYANGVVRVNSQCLTPNFGVDGKLSDVHEHLSDCKLIPKPQLQSARKVLDEVPLPTFIREMAEAAKITGLDSAQDDCDTIYEDSYDSLAYKQIFAKLGTLDGPYLWDLVILGASQARFSKLQSLVHMGSQTADQLLLADEHYDGNLTKCSLLQVKNESLIVSYTLPSMSSAKSVVLPFLLDDLEWFAGSSLSMIFGMEVYNTRVFKLEKGTPLILRDGSMLKLTLSELNTRPCCGIGYKSDIESLISVDSTWAMLDKIDIIILRSDGISCQFFYPGIGRTIFVLDSSFTLEDKGDFRGEEDKVYSLEVFDPGGECLGMICECLNYAFTSSLNRVSSKCDEGIEAQFKVANVATLKLIEVSNNYVPLSCDHACIDSDNKLSFQMKNYDLRGMKMIKITRLGQSYLDISSVNLIQYGKNLLGGQSTCMYLEFIYESSSHSVGSQLGSIMYGVASGTHEMGYYEALIALYATIDMKSFKGPKHSSVSLVILPVTWILLSEVVGIYGWNHTHTSNYGYFTTIFFLAPAFMSHIAPLNATEVKVIFVFDPGGYESGLKMRIRPRICGGKGVPYGRHKDHQTYVFDPGGSSIIQVTNAMRELRKVLCYACFIRRLRSILLVFDP